MPTRLRPCVAVQVPPGPDGLAELMPALAAALAGTGPAIAPLPTTGAPGYRSRLHAAVRPGEPVADGVAVVAATSGSTGDPAGVLLPASALRAAASGLTRRFEAPEGFRWVAALPLHHAGGLMVAVRGALAGIVPVAVASLGGAEQFSVAGLAAATARARRLSAGDGLPLAVSLVPAMLAQVDSLGAEGWDLLCEYDLVLVGGAAAPRSLVDRLRFAGVALSTSYGLTETCGGAVVDGLPLPGSTVSVDPAGRLVVCGLQVGLGYRDGRDPDRWSGGADGARRFRTDDLGRVDALGGVTVEGRVDDVVQVGGGSVSLGAVRSALLTSPDIADAEVVAVPDARWGARLVAVVVVAEPVPDAGATPSSPGQSSRPSDTASPAAALRPSIAMEIRDRVTSELGPSAQPREVLFVSSIPLLDSGKPDRAALRQLAEQASND